MTSNVRGGRQLAGRLGARASRRAATGAGIALAALLLGTPACRFTARGVYSGMEQVYRPSAAWLHVERLTAAVKAWPLSLTFVPPEGCGAPGAHLAVLDVSCAALMAELEARALQAGAHVLGWREHPGSGRAAPAAAAEGVVTLRVHAVPWVPARELTAGSRQFFRHLREPGVPAMALPDDPEVAQRCDARAGAVMEQPIEVPSLSLELAAGGEALLRLERRFPPGEADDGSLLRSQVSFVIERGNDLGEVAVLQGEARDGLCTEGDVAWRRRSAVLPGDDDAAARRRAAQVQEIAEAFAQAWRSGG